MKEFIKFLVRQGFRPTSISSIITHNTILIGVDVSEDSKSISLTCYLSEIEEFLYSKYSMTVDIKRVTVDNSLPKWWIWLYVRQPGSYKQLYGDTYKGEKNQCIIEFMKGLKNTFIENKLWD